MKALNSYRTKNRNLETGVEMEKYSVLLVDDEEDVIQIIMKKMDWESMGFQVLMNLNMQKKQFRLKWRNIF